MNETPDQTPKLGLLLRCGQVMTQADVEFGAS